MALLDDQVLAATDIGATQDQSGYSQSVLDAAASLGMTPQQAVEYMKGMGIDMRMSELDEQMARANELRGTAMPGMRDTGTGTIVAANPLEFLSTEMNRYYGKKEADAVKEGRAQAQQDYQKSALLASNASTKAQREWMDRMFPQGGQGGAGPTGQPMSVADEVRASLGGGAQPQRPPQVPGMQGGAPCGQMQPNPNQGLINSLTPNIQGMLRSPMQPDPNQMRGPQQGQPPPQIQPELQTQQPPQGWAGDNPARQAMAGRLSALMNWKGLAPDRSPSATRARGMANQMGPPTPPTMADRPWPETRYPWPDGYR